MGKNSPSSWAPSLASLSLLALTVAGCGAAEEPPPGFQGVVELEESLVSAEIDGRVEGVEIRRGDHVESGDVLAQLDDTMSRRALAVREGEVEVARADLALLRAGSRKQDLMALAAQLRAARSLETVLGRAAARAQQLERSGALPLAERERADSERERATAERQSLEAKLASAASGARPEELARASAREEAASRASDLERERVERATVRASIEGTVTDVLVEPGERVGVGSPVATVADADHPYVDVFVPQGELGGVRVGASATIRVDAGSHATTGAVEWISPRTEFTPRFLFSAAERPNLVVRVRVRIDDPEHELHAGVPAFVEIRR